MTPPKNTSLRLLPFVAILLCLAGCSRSSSAPTPMGGAHAVVEATPALAGGESLTAAAPIPPSDRSLVVTTDIAITVDRVDITAARIRDAVHQSGGYVADMHTSGADGEQFANLELRVPADKVVSVRSSLGHLGDVTSTSEKVEDVTEQRADLDARLHNARIEEKRLLDIQGQQGASVQDLVDAEKEISRVRENIERLEAQDRVMKSRITLATIRVSLTTKSTPAWQTPGVSLVRAGKTGVHGAAAFSVYAAMAFVTIAPTVVPIAALIFGIAMIVRRRRRRPSQAMLMTMIRPTT